MVAARFRVQPVWSVATQLPLTLRNTAGFACRALMVFSIRSRMGVIVVLRRFTFRVALTPAAGTAQDFTTAVVFSSPFWMVLASSFRISLKSAACAVATRARVRVVRRRFTLLSVGWAV